MSTATTPGPSSAPAPILHLMTTLPHDVPTVLDPANPQHKAAIEAALAAGDCTPARYPLLHAAGMAPSKAAGHPDYINFIDKGADHHGRATAMAVHVSPGPTLFQGGTTFAADAQTGALLATGHNSSVQEGLVVVSTDTATAKPAGKLVNLLAIQHSVTPDSQVRFTALASSAAVLTPAATTSFVYNVCQPTLTPKNGQYVIISLGRMQGYNNNLDSDYVYTEPSNLPNPYLIVPFVGTCQLPYPISGTVGQPIAGASYSSVIYYTSSSASTVALYSTSDKINANIKLEANSTVSWNFPFDGLSYTNTTSLVYLPQSLTNEQISYFSFSFTVPIDGQSPQSFSVCSIGTPNETTPQCFKVKNIEFNFHCLAAGTLVTMADGSKRPIETLTNADRVKSNTHGTSLAVEATIYGSHHAAATDTGAGAVYKLVTANGHELIGTGLHKIVTPQGLRSLYELAHGQTVVTDAGPVAVTSCTAIAWSGAFYNLSLGNDDDREKGLQAGAICTFVANGIEVGDRHALHHERRLIALDVNHPRSKVPVQLVTDYTSAVADIRY